MLNGISDLMGAQTDRLRCEVFQNLVLSPINTGTLRHAVATVLTVYGIETYYYRSSQSSIRYGVATVLTVYGIETRWNKFHRVSKIFSKLQQCLPFTVLKLTKLVPWV